MNSCPICPHACSVVEGKHGLCGARVGRDNAMVAENYGRITSLALDPIEKKPLARFHPGSMILSAGSYGCNLRCSFCQNASISQVAMTTPPYEDITPRQLIRAARSYREQGNIGIAYTYNEPLVGYEFVYDCATLAHEQGLLNVLVTNGYINIEPWQALLPHLDAANIDLKGFTQDFYDLVNAPHGLATVKRSIELAATRIHVEITTLIIPGLNDSATEINDLASWIATISPTIPLHLTRFYPTYHMQDRQATSRQSILDLQQIAQQHLRYVYPGNMA